MPTKSDGSDILQRRQMLCRRELAFALQPLRTNPESGQPLGSKSYKCRRNSIRNRTSRNFFCMFELLSLRIVAHSAGLRASGRF